MCACVRLYGSVCEYDIARKLHTTQLRVSTISDNVIAVYAQQRYIRSGSAVGYFLSLFHAFLSLRIYLHITNILIITSLQFYFKKRLQRYRYVYHISSTTSAMCYVTDSRKYSLRPSTAVNEKSDFLQADEAGVKPY